MHTEPPHSGAQKRVLVHFVRKALLALSSSSPLSSTQQDRPRGALGCGRTASSSTFETKVQARLAAVADAFEASARSSCVSPARSRVPPTSRLLWSSRSAPLLTGVPSLRDCYVSLFRSLGCRVSCHAEQDAFCIFVANTAALRHITQGCAAPNNRLSLEATDGESL